VGNLSFLFDQSSTVPTLPGSYKIDGSVLDMEVGSLDDYDITVNPATYQRRTSCSTTRPNRWWHRVHHGFGFGFSNATVLFDGEPATGVDCLTQAR
jgi:hypothetical protein